MRGWVGGWAAAEAFDLSVAHTLLGLECICVAKTMSLLPSLSLLDMYWLPGFVMVFSLLSWCPSSWNRCVYDEKFLISFVAVGCPQHPQAEPHTNPHI